MQLKEKDNDEDFRIAKALAKKEAKEYNEEVRKNLKYEQDMHAINLHRKETVQRKEELKARQEAEDVEFMKQKMETDLLYQLYEREKQHKAQEKMTQISKKNLKLNVSVGGFRGNTFSALNCLFLFVYGRVSEGEEGRGEAGKVLGEGVCVQGAGAHAVGGQAVRGVHDECDRLYGEAWPECVPHEEGKVAAGSVGFFGGRRV